MKELKLFIKDMQNEAALLKEFAELEDQMQLCAGENRWEDIERVIGELKGKAGTLNSIEECRCASFDALKKKLGLPCETGFLKLLPIVPVTERERLLSAYRKLKVAVFSVKGATTRLTYYFRSMEGSFKKVLGELFPHRKGKIYSKDGRPKKVPDDALLLNKHL
ncbi:MAG: hypothetical protein P8107_07170 [Spirochaetia bacterium]|jgi:hypothetical protein